MKKENGSAEAISSHLTSIRTRRLAKKAKVELKPKSSRRDRARQPFWLHSSTAADAGLRKTGSQPRGISQSL
jgi:hypothetical protein